MDLKFWWHINWPEQVQARAAKARTNEMISINALEYAAIIINLVATTSTILASPSDQDPYPTVLYFIDNVTLEAWMQKVAKNSPAGKSTWYTPMHSHDQQPSGDQCRLHLHY